MHDQEIKMVIISNVSAGSVIVESIIVFDINVPLLNDDYIANALINGNRSK